MSTWQTAVLGTLCRDVTVGHVGKMSDQYVPCGVPFLRSQDINPGWIDLTNIKYVSREFHGRLRKSALVPGDVVIVRTGYPGTAAVVPTDLPEANCADLVIIRPGPLLLPKFLAYLLNSPWGVSIIRGRLVGAAQQHFNIKVAHALEIPVPPLDAQRRIVEILGAYDDLIDVNRRRVALLEDVARGLFEEWFVRFRFPSYETVPLVETAEGALPTGWLITPLENVADVNAASLRPAAAPERIGYIDIASVSPGQVDAINWMPFVDAPGRARRCVKDGSILWSNVRPNRRSFALLTRPENAVIASTGFTVLDARQVPPCYLYCFTTTPAFVAYLVGRATGAAYPAVTAAVFSTAPVIVPPDGLLRQFAAIATPSFELADAYRQSNNRLATSRDLLLPRLISGQLSVLEAERELAQAA